MSFGWARAPISALMILAGCAMLKNTPQQDYVWEIARVCDARSAFWKMEEVKPDGSSTVRGATNAPPGWNDYQACMREQMERKPYGQWVRERSRSIPAAAVIPPATGGAPSEQGTTATAVVSTKAASPSVPVTRHSERVLRVPVQIIESQVLVPVTLDRAQGATLLLDTGSQYTILTPEAAKRVGLVVADGTPKRPLSLVGGQRIEVPFLRLYIMEIGGAVLGNIEVGIYAVAPESSIIDGLLGADILSRFTFSLDPVAKQLHLEPREK